ncbi:MAG: DNA polymerase [Halocynthiibacter sp.]|jgi:DNA polymerase
MDFYAARAALDWQIELGADEAICDAPINRYEAPAEAPKSLPETALAPGKMATPDRPAIPEIPKALQVDAAEEAATLAKSAQDIKALHAAMAAFEHCELKRGARNLVFADGSINADIMIICDAPGREDDIAGKPALGQSGALLDKMFAAINCSRTSEQPDAAIYITPVIPWRPPNDREPSDEELAMMAPFIARHIALAQPKAIVLMGNAACQAMLGKRGITRLRGTWAELDGLPALAMQSPAHLLRTPLAKREAWADLQALQARLASQGTS